MLLTPRTPKSYHSPLHPSSPSTSTPTPSMPVKHLFVPCTSLPPPRPVLTIIPPSVVRRLIPRISNSTPKPGGEIYAHSIPRKSKALAPRLGHPSNSLNSFHHSTNLATHHSLKDASHCCDQEPGDSSLLKKPSNGVTEAVLTFLLQFVQSLIVPVATLSGCPTCPPGNIESLA